MVAMQRLDSRPGAADTEPMLTRPVQIQRVVRETHDTFSLELKDRDRSEPFAFAPGQFNMVYIFGVGEIPISISGDPTKPGVLVHTTRAVGAVTKAMQRLKIGDTIGIRGPYGTSWPVEQARDHDVVIVAGGIGLAPLRPVVHHILANREAYGQVVLLYGARTPEDILYRKQLEKWRSRLDFEVFLTVDRASGTWRGNVGVVTTLTARAPFDRQQSIAMVCGPEIMMRYSILELEKRGIADDRIFISMERNMKCGIGLCGHCQIGPTFVCKDGPVYPYTQMRNVLTKREL